MKLDAATLAALAEHLETCQLQARDTPKITDEHPEMDFEDAYAIQNLILQRKLARGFRELGKNLFNILKIALPLFSQQQ